MRIVVTPLGEPIRLNDDGTWQSARPSGSILERLKSLRPSPEIVGAYAELFHRVTIRVIDTDERVLCVHHGDRIEFGAVNDADVGDFAVDIYGYQAERLADQVDRGIIDPPGRFRIARALITARQRGPNSLLRNPLMSNAALRKIISGQTLRHVHLVSPDQTEEPDARMTWIYADPEWIVVPGLHGTAQRTFRLTVDDAMELQRQLFKWFYGW
jgi:hypothetical protein